MKIFEHGLDFLTDTIKEETHFSFDGVEEIGTSDINCCVNNILKHFYTDKNDASYIEWEIVRNGVRNTLLNNHG
jgi:hypothetical protein